MPAGTRSDFRGAPAPMSRCGPGHLVAAMVGYLDYDVTVSSGSRPSATWRLQARFYTPQLRGRPEVCTTPRSQLPPARQRRKAGRPDRHAELGPAGPWVASVDNT